jgi:hypothetical protein
VINLFPLSQFEEKVGFIAFKQIEERNLKSSALLFPPQPTLYLDEEIPRLALSPVEYRIMAGEKIDGPYAGFYYLEASGNLLKLESPFLLRDILQSLSVNPQCLNINGINYTIIDSSHFYSEHIPGNIGYSLTLERDRRKLWLYLIPHLKSGKESGAGLVAYIKVQGIDPDAKQIALNLKTALLEAQAQEKDILGLDLNALRAKVSQAYRTSINKDKIEESLTNLLMEFYFPGLRQSQLLPSQTNFLTGEISRLISMLTPQKEVKLEDLFSIPSDTMDKKIAEAGESYFFRWETLAGKKDFFNINNFKFSLVISVKGKSGEERKLKEHFLALKRVTIEFTSGDTPEDTKKAKISLAIPEPVIEEKREEGEVIVKAELSPVFNKEAMEVPADFDWRNVVEARISIVSEGAVELIVRMKVDLDKSLFAMVSTKPEDLVAEYQTANLFKPYLFEHFSNPETLLGPDPKARSNQLFYNYLFPYVEETNLGLKKGNNALNEVLRLIKWRYENIQFLKEKLSAPLWPYLPQDMRKILVFEKYLNQQKVTIFNVTFDGGYLNSLFLPNYQSNIRQMRERAWQEAKNAGEFPGS